MPALSDANIRAAFERSNIPASDWDRQSRVLDGALLNVNLPRSAVLAVSQTEMSLKPDGSSMGTVAVLLIVFPSGLALAQEKGLFSKRIDVQSISYRKTSAVLPDEKRYDPRRGEMAIQGMVSGSVPRFRIGWNWSQGGPTDAADAAAERDRILKTIQRAMQGDYAVPGAARDSEPAGRPAATLSGNAAIARDPAAENLPSQRQHLIDWTARLFREAGVTPVPEHVEQVARTAAIGLFVSRVVAFADARPLPSLQHYCRNLPGDLPDRFEQFDDIYGTWIRLATEEDAGTQDSSDPRYTRIRQQHISLVDHAIDSCLAESEDSFRAGIRADYR